MIVNRTVSIVCGAKNRTQHLTRSLDTWLACPEVDEVVLVDWSSDVPVTCSDRRVLTVRVEGQKYWIASKCHNLELLMSKGELVLRLDADDCLSPEFFIRHPLRDDEFYCFNGCGSVGPQALGEDWGLMGVIYAPRKLFDRVNGYNEKLALYSHEDVDLIERLERVALRRDLDLSYLKHLPHSDEARVVHEPPPRADDLRFAPPPIGTWQSQTRTGHSMATNRALSAAQPWTAVDRKVEWSWSRFEDEKLVVCTEKLRDLSK